MEGRLVEAGTEQMVAVAQTEEGRVAAAAAAVN